MNFKMIKRAWMTKDKGKVFRVNYTVLVQREDLIIAENKQEAMEVVEEEGCFQPTSNEVKSVKFNAISFERERG